MASVLPVLLEQGSAKTLSGDIGMGVSVSVEDLQMNRFIVALQHSNADLAFYISMSYLLTTNFPAPTFQRQSSKLGDLI